MYMNLDTLDVYHAVLVLNARHLSVSALLHWYIIGVPIWALGWLPLGLEDEAF